MASGWRAKVLPVSLAVLGVLSILPWSILGAFEESPTLSFFALDVGQGDAIWIETPDHYQVLIDGGPGRTILEKLGERMHFWDREIDLVVLTHPHADHVSGLLEVLRRYRVNAVIESGAEYGTAEYAEWDTLLEKNGVTQYLAVSGMKVLLGKYAELLVLAPLDSAVGKSFSNVHDANVVSELRIGGVTFLLMGDAEAKLERTLISEHLISDVAVLKVGHHGSKTSSSDIFLRRAAPEIAVVSVGARNRYGHPASLVLDRLQEAGIRILRTDTMGDVVIKTDGKELSSVEFIAE
ncbi:MAG: MBL fold metallo-hydrolase [Candidatus Sungbacteria bacterium]|nr:MBL fold metallo-hydrolase [Candidatus Sungbacteria bacterium]